MFCHLLQHKQINEIFLRYFKQSLNTLVETQFVKENRKNNLEIPQDFLINHISVSYIEMIYW